MGKAGYVAPTGAVVALAATTTKTILGVVAPAQFGLDLLKIRYAFDGANPTAAGVLVELMNCTFAAQPPGTNSTVITPVQVYGRTITPGFTAGYGWSAEPTAQTLIESTYLAPTSGLWYDFPLSTSIDTSAAVGLALRMTAPAAVNARASMWLERC
jgi:hypothetical protein